MDAASPLTWPPAPTSEDLENAMGDQEMAQRTSYKTTRTEAVSASREAEGTVTASGLTTSATAGASDLMASHARHHVKQRRSAEENPNLGLKETKAVSCLRLIVLAVLVTSATCTAIAVYYYTLNSEIAAFENSYYDDADHVIHGVGTALYVTLGAMDTYIAELIGHANDTGQEWPFVTIHDTPVHLAKLSSTSKAVFAQQSHFVTAAQRQEWENYTSYKSDWMEFAQKVQQVDPNLAHISLYFPERDGGGEASITHLNQSVIHSFQGPATGTGPFLPTWLSYPILPCTFPFTILLLSFFLYYVCSASSSC
jgi:hypothetical protein